MIDLVSGVFDIISNHPDQYGLPYSFEESERFHLCHSYILVGSLVPSSKSLQFSLSNQGIIAFSCEFSGCVYVVLSQRSSENLRKRRHGNNVSLHVDAQILCGVDRHVVSDIWSNPDL